MLERYGIEHTFQAGSPFIDIRTDTYLEKYGVDHPLKNSEVQEQIKQTNLERYGETNPMKNADVKEKSRLTNLERYGVENPMMSSAIKEKVKQTTRNRYGTDYHNQRHNASAFRKLSDKSWLYNQYITKRKTLEAIAEDLGGITPNVVGLYLNRHNIDTRTTQRYSYECIRWLESIMKESDLFIQHALNLGEYRIPNMNLTVDGYCKDTNTIYEFYGDIWHGNPKLYEDNEFCHPFYTDITAGELYRKTLDREKLLKELGYSLKTIWESDWLLKNK